jgi:hypothetical protein
MKKYSTVDAAVNLVIENFEANHIVCDETSIYKRVYSWYCHSDVTDPEMLAACALMGTDWFPGANYDYMLAAKNYWFPQDIYNIAIWEVEEAQHDAMWW